MLGRRPIERGAFAFLIAILNVPSSRAFWRLPCQAAPLVVERADPLTNPGGISQHVHAIHGGSNFNLDMTYDDATKSDCTSCQVKQDLSNYWTPQLYFAWKNGSFTSVGGGGLLVYYLQRFHETDQDPIQAFPKDFRMLVGNPYTRSYDDSSLMSRGIGWNCLGGQGLSQTKNPRLPSVNCPNSLRAEIMFPSCWDGENVDSSNHISHMAYPEDNESGPCPSSHPKRLVTIFYEIWWSTDPFKDSWQDALNTSQPFVLSTGDPLGYGLHGDFLNGWDIDVLQQAIDECTSDSGVIDECKVFDLTDYSKSTGDSCVQSQAVQESTLGTLDALPGCNPIDYGPGDVTVCNEPSPPSIENAVKVSGYLVEGSKELKVNKEDAGSTENGSDGQDEKESESTQKASQTLTSSAEPPRKTSPNQASASSTRPASSSTSSSDSESPSTSTMFNKDNKWIFVVLACLAFVVTFASIAFCCHQRNAKPTSMASASKSSRRETDQEARNLNHLSSSDSQDDSDFDDWAKKSAA
ncbi:hypothetical protein JCM3766R1_004355 [Sporobolomyces carnicolor]